MYIVILYCSCMHLEYSRRRLQPKYIEKQVGETTSFFCSSEMKYPFWIFHYRLIFPIKKKVLFSDSDLHLTIPNIGDYHSGQYTCVGRGNDMIFFSKSFMSSAYLKVFSKLSHFSFSVLSIPLARYLT